MTQPPLALFALLALLLIGTPSCGGSDDDCYWERRCESIGGELTCVWVKICPGDAGYGSSEGATFPIEAAPENETWAVRFGATEGTSPVVARLLGAAVMASVGGEGPRPWWLHGWPAREVDRAVRAHGGRDVERIWPQSGPSARDVGCRNYVSVEALPPLPASLRLGQSLQVVAPAASTLVPTNPFLGIAAYVTSPARDAARTWILGEGETVDIPLERPGPWRVRLVLITEDLCELGVRDAVLLEDAVVEVVSAPDARFLDDSD